MKLLICTQAVDRDDPVLGFFHRWIEEFAKRCDHVLVVCLRKGNVSLPENVEVIALGERDKFLRAVELCSIAWGRRGEYDAVFVHMNPEYVIAAGWLWRLMGKRIGLWYVHKSVHLLHAALPFINRVFTATRHTFPIVSGKVIITGHGIDTDFFRPDPLASRDRYVLSAGRLDESKHHDLIIRAAAIAGMPVRIAGDGPLRSALEKLAGGGAEFLGGVTQTRLREEFQRARVFVHASTTGGLDKVVLEAAACGCGVITTAAWLREYMPVRVADPTPEALADALQQEDAPKSGREAVERGHSLARLIPKIVELLT